MSVSFVHHFQPTTGSVEEVSPGVDDGAVRRLKTRVITMDINSVKKKRLIILSLLTAILVGLSYSTLPLITAVAFTSSSLLGLWLVFGLLHLV